jgi:hypothetical protein
MKTRKQSRGNTNIEAIIPGQISTDMVLNKLHVTWFMERNGYDSLIPLVNDKCGVVNIDGKDYYRYNDVESVSWPTFILKMRELVDVELRALPV